MGLKGKATSSGGDFEPAPEGTHSAVCTRVVDQGTQDTKFGPKRRIQLGFEIDEKREDGKRYMAFGNYTLSLHEKATLRKMLEAWRGRAYHEDDDIDLAALIGRPCLLSLVRSDNGDYTNISSIAPLVKGMTPIAPEGDTVLFDCDEPDLGELAKLGDSFQERIMGSPEYKAAMNGAGPASEPHAPENVGQYDERNPPPPGDDDLNDSIPFSNYMLRSGYAIC